MRSAVAGLAALAGFVTGCGGAPETPAATSPYVAEQAREIKALSPDEVAGLLAGEGLGYALAAELNGLPGPRHVLDAAAELELDDDQRARVQAIFDAMNAEAVRLGADLVEAERGLDRMFAAGHATPDAVDRATAEIGRLEGALRGVHLRAHLETTPVLTAQQRARYAEVRGYHEGQPAGSTGDHQPGHH